MNWVFLLLIHNLSLQEPIEGDFLAMVPETDARAACLLKRSSALRQLVSNFTDQFGRPVHPTLLLAKKDAPSNVFQQDAIVGFRNVIAISAIVYAWQDSLVKRISLNVLKYSEYFNIYPITISKDGEDLIIRSPSLLGLDEPKDFRGQTSAELAPSHRMKDFLDKELLAALMATWKVRFVDSSGDDWRTRALFRSLEMAYHASAIPFWNNSTLYDYGSSIGLWVSALEILAHPGGTERVDKKKILDLIGRVSFDARSLKNRYYMVWWHEKKIRVNLCQKLIDQLYAVRNDFLHGNPISDSTIHAFRNQHRHPLNYFAPLLYKSALISFLGLGGKKDFERIEISEFMNFRNFEEALLISKKDQRRRGQRSN